MNSRKGMITGIIIAVVALIIIGFVVFAAVNEDTDDSDDDYEDSLDVSASAISNAGKEYTIEITSSGFSPANLEINQGNKVTWINRDSEKRWPASAMHPTHTAYAGGHYEESGSYAGSQACQSEGVAKTGAFDPCKGLVQGESWTFTFNEKGTWSYHDHLVSGKFGKITVK